MGPARWHLCARRALVSFALLCLPAIHAAAPQPSFSQPWQQQPPPPGALRGPVESEWEQTAALHEAARAYVDSKFRYDNNFMCEGSRVHGLVRKTAPRRPEPDAAALAAFQARNLSIVGNDNLLMIFERHKIIYMRQPKASSTTISKLLMEMLCQGLSHDPGQGCYWLGNQGHLGQLDWDAYFVITWIRNPLARMASSFTYFNASMHRMLEQERVGEPCLAQSFAGFSRRVAGMSEACARERCCSWLHAPMGGASWWRRPWFVAQHSLEMSHFVYTNDGRSTVDFIGRTENLYEDWHKLSLMLQGWTRQNLTVSSRYLRPLNHQAIESPHRADELACEGLRYAQLYDATSMRDMALQFAMDLWRFGFLEPAHAAPGSWFRGTGQTE